MKRYFFIGTNLDNLEAIETELEARHFATPQIHVLSRDDAGVQEHHLHQVHSLLRKDVIHSGEIGALVGLGVSFLSIAVAYASHLPETIGWLPFICLSLVLLGFFTWEGGLFGIQVPNSRFRRFEEALRSGRHLLFVDAEPHQETALRQVLSGYPELESAGTGLSAPRWLVMWQQKWRDFLHWAP